MDPRREISPCRRLSENVLLECRFMGSCNRGYKSPNKATNSVTRVVLLITTLLLATYEPSSMSCDVRCVRRGISQKLRG